jgi:hypothetical protein|tara:strand:+ start:294 stop:533 length:240 start_codon:yes stop_codon:yes gene_type:complete
MAISDWMADMLEDSCRDMETIADNLNSRRSPCCKEKARFNLWDDEDEARLHKRVVSVGKRIDEILIDLDKVVASREKAS